MDKKVHRETSAPEIEDTEERKTFEIIERLSKMDGEMDWMDLKELLDEHFQIPTFSYKFSKEHCRSLVAMLDEDCSGKLCFSELKKLWIILEDWKKAWILHDINKSGTFDGFELRAAMKDAGYLLNSRLLNVIMRRYGNKGGEITFGDFITCAIKLKIMIDIFQERESESNIAEFTMREWLEFNLY